MYDVGYDGGGAGGPRDKRAFRVNRRDGFYRYRIIVARANGRRRPQCVFGTLVRRSGNGCAGGDSYFDRIKTPMGVRDYLRSRAIRDCGD